MQGWQVGNKAQAARELASSDAGHVQLDSGAASDVQLDNGAEHEAEQPGHRPYARGASRPLTASIIASIVEMRRDAISTVEMRGTEGPSAWNSLQASAAELTPRRQRQKRLPCVWFTPGRSLALAPCRGVVRFVCVRVPVRVRACVHACLYVCVRGERQPLKVILLSRDLCCG